MKKKSKKWGRTAPAKRKRLMRQIAAVAERKGLPCTITPDEVREVKL